MSSANPRRSRSRRSSRRLTNDRDDDQRQQHDADGGEVAQRDVHRLFDGKREKGDRGDRRLNDEPDLNRADEPPPPATLAEQALRADQAQKDERQQAGHDLHEGVLAHVETSLYTTGREGQCRVAVGLFDKLFKKAEPTSEEAEAPKAAEAPSAWELAMNEVNGLAERLLFEEARERLEAVAEELGETGDAYQRAVTTGRIGECSFQLGEAERALQCFEQAQKLCEDAGDEDGISAYLGSRIEALRWLGCHGEAVPLAETLAERHEAAGDEAAAMRVRARARVMKNGEPLLRACVEIGDVVYELDELPEDIEGEARVMMERNRMALARVERLVQEGRARGSASAYDEAIALFATAMDADPHDPMPVYESAFTYAMKGDFEEAIELYERVEELAPGWFNTRSDLWLAEKIDDGLFPPDVWSVVVELETGVSGPQEKLAMAKILTERMPKLGQGWLHLARCHAMLGENDECLAAFEKGLANTDEPDVKTRMLFESAAQDPENLRGRLEEAVELRGHVAAAAMAAVVLHATRP